MLKVIVFDFDYTLGDSANGIVLSANYALEKLGHTAQKADEIKKTIGLSLNETYTALTGDHDSKATEQFVKFFREKADVIMVENTTLYAGVKETLTKLREHGYKTAIVTTKFHYRIEQILNKFDARNLIDDIVGAEDVKAVKPSPEGLLWAIKHSGAKKEDALYIGDSIVDAKTAENANVDFAAVLTGTTPREEFEKHRNVYIGKDISDIYNFIMLYSN